MQQNNLSQKNKTLFLDRDGTINVDMTGGYVTKTSELKLIPGTAKSLKRAQDAGYKLAIITNQQGIGKGLYTTEILQTIHTHLESLIAKELNLEKFNFDAIEFCPHLAADNCNCRKPKPGMLENAILKLNSDLENSFYLGDKDADLLCAKAVGIKSILVRTGYGNQTALEIEKWSSGKPVHVADRIDTAINWILS